MTPDISPIKIHNFSDTFVNKPVHFRILETDQKLLHVWFGTSDGTYSASSYSIPLIENPPSSCAIVGHEDATDILRNISNRLAKVYRRPIYLASAFYEIDSTFQLWLERTLNHYLKQHIIKP